jgi:hypothetical protein
MTTTVSAKRRPPLVPLLGPAGESAGNVPPGVTSSVGPRSVDRFGANEADRMPAALIQAQAVVALHVATTDGFCGGCLEQWARLAPARCEQSIWALALVEAHGVAMVGVPPVASSSEEAEHCAPGPYPDGLGHGTPHTNQPSVVGW